jgi:hypothetical protein
MNGLVFMSYARTDAERVRPLVDFLSNEGIPVWWDKAIEPGQRFRDAIYDVLEKASCVIVAWSHDSVQRDWVRAEAGQALERGALIPVLLDRDTKVPLPFTELEQLDLSEWDGRKDETANLLLSAVKALSERKTYLSGYRGTVVGDDWAIDQSKSATHELKDLVSKIESLGEVLLGDEAPVQDVLGALVEVDKTYRAIMDAVTRFVRPALAQGPLDAEPFLEFERGVLASDIEAGRGHCLRILTFYARAHGLRDWLEPRMSAEKLAQLDDVFERLGTADGDLFRQMSEIGQVLTNESRVIVNLLLSGQENRARQRIREGREKLKPLEEAVGEAQGQLKELQTRLGFASESGK